MVFWPPESLVRIPEVFWGTWFGASNPRHHSSSLPYICMLFPSGRFLSCHSLQTMEGSDLKSAASHASETWQTSDILRMAVINWIGPASMRDPKFCVTRILAPWWPCPQALTVYCHTRQVPANQYLSIFPLQPIPFSGIIQGGLQEGLQITIQGTIHALANRYVGDTCLFIAVKRHSNSHKRRH